MTQPRRSMRDRRLLAYAVGGLALASAEASGEIVYRQLGPQVIYPNESFSLDVDQDGLDNLTLASRKFHRSSCTETTSSFSRDGGRGGGGKNCWTSSQNFAWAEGLGAGQTAVRLVKNFYGWARLFTAGETIYPQSADEQHARLAYSSRLSFSYGTPFLGGEFRGERGYLGFAISGGSKAGWAQIEVELSQTTPSRIAAIRVFDYAYETVAGIPVLAGDTGATVNIPGDTNGDGQVDLEDLNNVRNNFGATEIGVLGDTNDDGLVDLEDLNAVRNNFGAGNPVPEPPTLVLLAAGAAGLTALRRRRGQSATTACSP